VKIDRPIQQAIRGAVAHFRTNSDLARAAGVTQPAIGRWLDGKAAAISDANWERLYPVIAKWLPDDPSYWPRSMLAALGDRGLGRAHPCDGRPPWLVEMCRAWDEIPADYKTAVRIACMAALGGTQDAAKNPPMAETG